jgi:hypothetical protein
MIDRCKINREIEVSSQKTEVGISQDNNQDNEWSGEPEKEA